MERGSAKHGPRVDDTLEREDHDLIQGAGPNPHGGPVLEEAPAEDELSIGTDPRVEDPSLAPPESALEDRAQLATFVRPSELPSTGVELSATAAELGAPADVIERFQQLPEGRIYETFQEIWDDVSHGELPPNV